MKTLKQFAIGMAKYRGLFERPDDLSRYHGMIAGGLYQLASPIIRAAYSRIGYEEINRLLRPETHDRLLKASGKREHVDYGFIGTAIPSDFVLSFSEGFYGTGLRGSFLLTDLLRLDGESLEIVNRGAIFQQMLLAYVIGGSFDSNGNNKALRKMHQYYILNRGDEDLTIMVRCHLVGEFLKSTTGIPVGWTESCSDAVAEDLSDRIRFVLTAFDAIYVTDDVICDAWFNKIVDARSYTAFFDEMVTKGLMIDLAAAFRLDKDPE
jgi:hypothetical protein